MKLKGVWQHPLTVSIIANVIYSAIISPILIWLYSGFNSVPINWNLLWILVPVISSVLFFLFRNKRSRVSKLEKLPVTELTEIEIEEPNSESKKDEMCTKAPYNWLDSDIYFADCIAQTFPGDRGVVWYNSPSTAVRKLKLFFENLNRDYPDGDAVWWRRGGSAFSIARAEVLDSNKILLENDRFQITRMAVCVSQYYKHFIYIEAAPEPSVCIPPTVVPDDLKEMRGYYTEEYAEFQGRIISRHEYDDGAAIFGEKVVPLHGQARLRVRYLTKVNFVLTAKNSSYNNNRFERLSEEFFNEALESEAGKKKFFEFMDTFQKIDKPEYRR